jgi:drug/metabolite transporter (DMT)-like permease
MKNEVTITKGIACALAAGLMWGLVFIIPILLPEYSGIMLAIGRYLAFGTISLLVAWPMREGLATLNRADWIEATKLSLIGNMLYYSCLAAAIQLADPPLVAMIIGALPVVVAIVGNMKDASLPWGKLAFPLATIALGIAAVNHEELSRIEESGTFNLQTHGLGVLLAIVALICWTWYPIRNGAWLQKNPHIDSGSWSTVQGLTTLPLAIVGCVGLLVFSAWRGDAVGVETLVGPTPLKFITLMVVMGFFASWLGTLFWNYASQMLPTSLVGQLIVFETLAALFYAYLWRASTPGWVSVAGIALLIAGVMLGVSAFNSERTSSKEQ